MTDNRTTELLPCPFCGGESIVERIGKSGYFYVACNTAYCCDFGKFNTEAEAIAAWNTRADYHGYKQAAIEAWENIKVWNTRAIHGTLTAEQVMAIAGRHQPDYCSDTHACFDWQAIADELNAALVGGTCEMEIENDIEDMCGEHYVYFIGWTCSECGNQMTSMYESDAPNFCPNCGKKVER